MPIAYRSVLASSAIVAESLTITNPPTTTTYVQGDTLDTTGLVVTAVVEGVSGDVTSRCVITPTTLNTSGTQTISVFYGGKRTSFDVTVIAISAIEITTAPKTTYSPGDTLNLTGMVVTATAGVLTRDVTSKCTTSPADGTALPTLGTYTLTVSYLGFTDTIDYSVISISIYGAEYTGVADNPAWTRTDDAASFGSPITYYSGMSGTPSSPFDNIMPWAGMQVVEDEQAGSLVAIPKFWYKWTRDEENAKYLKLQIASGPAQGFFVSPAHADRGDGKGERDVVYVGRYHSVSSTYKSTSDVKPVNKSTKSTMRNGIHTLGNNVWMMDYAMYWTVCMLYLIEFANWNGQAMIGRGGSLTNVSDVYVNGATDSMTYHTGNVGTAKDAYGPMQYRNIENWWGNVYDVLDGIYHSGDNVYCIKNPANFSDTSGGTLVGQLGSGSGVLQRWTNPTESGFEYAMVPAYASGSGYDYAIADQYSHPSSGNVVRFGCGYGRGTQWGPFYLEWSLAADTSLGATSGCRLMKLP